MFEFNQTPHNKKQIVELAIAFHATNIMIIIAYKFVESRKWPNSS
jgi:hypothetical protein